MALFSGVGTMNCSGSVQAFLLLVLTPVETTIIFRLLRSEKQYLKPEKKKAPLRWGFSAWRCKPIEADSHCIGYFLFHLTAHICLILNMDV